MIVVIYTPNTDAAGRLSKMLPHTDHVITCGGHVHRVYSAEEDADDREYRDPIDGALLVGFRTFASERAARRWIAGQR